jgi:hypothetical protein
LRIHGFEGGAKNLHFVIISKFHNQNDNASHGDSERDRG